MAFPLFARKQKSAAARVTPSRWVHTLFIGGVVVEMLKKKQAGIPTPRQRAEARPENVVNLMDALRRSLAEGKRVSATPKKGRKRVAGQTEMLLPIAGKKGKEVAVKPVAKPSARQKRTG